LEFRPDLDRIAARVCEHNGDTTAAKRALHEFLADYARPDDAEQAWTPRPLSFDFEADPETPDWIVHRLIERGTVVVLSGDTGAAKSIVTSSLLPAALEGNAWLGHGTHVERVMVLDEENPGRLVSARLRALGTTNELRERLRYFNREGVALGDGERSDAWLRSELESFRPDLLVIDTLMAACDLEDTNNNAEAVRMMKNLRAVAREFECAVLLLHHERKRSKEHPSSSGQAMMGARQWAGQADTHMTLTVESDLIEEKSPDGSGWRLRRTFKWRPAEKDRDGRSNIPRRVAVESEMDASGRLLWMTVEDEGPLTEETAQGAHEAMILAALADAEEDGTDTLRTAALAAATGAKSADDGSFKRALSDLLEAGKIEKPKHGHYRLTEHGREESPLGF
jgi:hypothetical protein